LQADHKTSHEQREAQDLSALIHPASGSAVIIVTCGIIAELYCVRSHATTISAGSSCRIMPPHTLILPLLSILAMAATKPAYIRK
jgi:hypothetical protein